MLKYSLHDIWIISVLSNYFSFRLVNVISIHKRFAAISNVKKQKRKKTEDGEKNE